MLFRSVFRVFTAFESKCKSLNKDEKTICPRDNSVKIRFIGPWGVEMPKGGHRIELASGEGSQIRCGVLICGKIIWQIRRLREGIKEMLDIDFGSAGDDNLEPRSLCSGIGQGPQETWATSMVATLVKCVNDKGESMLWVARKGSDEIKEERAFHRLRSKVWVIAKMFCDNGSKRREEYCEFVDESRKDVHGVAQMWVVPSAEKRTSKVVSLVKACTDRMG